MPVPLGGAENADLRWVHSRRRRASSGPTDFRRAGAALARAPRTGPAWRPRSPRSRPTAALEAFVVGAMLGSFGSTGAPTRPSTRRSPGSCSPACPTTRTRAGRSTGRSPSAAPAGGRGCSPRCRPTSRTPPGWPSRPIDAGRRVRPRSRRSGTSTARPPTASAASSASGRPRRRPPRLIQLDYTPAKGAAEGAARGPGRQGHHLRHRRPVHQARRGDGQHEARHDRRRRGARGHGARCAAVGCPVRVTGLVAAAENAIGGNALRPGDVVRHYGGRTTEVTNTDAEGRLVMADALAYAVAELDPDVARRRRHPDRRDEGRARPAGRRLLRQQRRRSPVHRARPARRPASRCGGSRSPPTTRRSCPPRSPTPTTPRAARARSRPRCSSSTSSASVPWAHLDIASVGDAPDGQLRVDRRARPASAPARC